MLDDRLHPPKDHVFWQFLQAIKATIRGNLLTALAQGGSGGMVVYRLELRAPRYGYGDGKFFPVAARSGRGGGLPASCIFSLTPVVRPRW